MKFKDIKHLKHSDKNMFADAVWMLRGEDAYEPRYRREMPPIVAATLRLAAAATPEGQVPPCVVVWHRQIYIRGTTPMHVFPDLRHGGSATTFRYYLRHFASLPGAEGTRRFNTYVAACLDPAYRRAAWSGTGKQL